MTVIKPQAPFERLKSANESPYVSLHKAILLQAIIDATSSGSSKKEIKLKTEAQDWLFNDSIEFRNACDAAQLSTNHIKDTAKKIIRLHHLSARANEIGKKAKTDNPTNLFKKDRIDCFKVA